MRALHRRVTVTVLAGGLVLGGCGAGDGPDLAPGAAEVLRDAVQEVATAAAQERYDAAADALTQVRAALDAAVESDAVSVQRYREIDRAIQRTAAELEELRGEQVAGPDAPGPEPAARATSAPDVSGTTSATAGGVEGTAGRVDGAAEREPDVRPTAPGEAQHPAPGRAGKGTPPGVPARDEVPGKGRGNGPVEGNGQGNGQGNGRGSAAGNGPPSG